MSSLFYFDYKGGKRCEVKNIFKYLDDEKMKTVKYFVEPFCGSCAVSLDYYTKKGYDKIKYHINDVDDGLINFLNDIKKDGINKFINNLRAVNLEESDKDIRRKAINKYMENRTAENYFNMKRLDTRYFVSDRTKKYLQNYSINKYKKTDEFFSNAVITKLDYKDIFEMYKDKEDAFIFVDPPYFDSDNTMYDIYNYKGKKTYGRKCEDNSKIFVDIIELMKNGKCKVIGITNGSALMNYIFKPWICETYGKTYQLTKKKTNHILFKNF